MKPIDVEPVLDKLGGYISECRSSNFYKNECYLQAFYLVKDMLLSAPEITEPPNDPLTLEELREMDDADVWVAYRPTMGGFWLRMHALVEVCKETGDVFLTNNIGGRSDFYDVTRDGGTIYRRKPEEGVQC